ncbi:MAG: hypothetical protein WBP86_05255, partial [Thiobacillaceae bacterium]
MKLLNNASFSPLTKGRQKGFLQPWSESSSQASAAPALPPKPAIFPVRPDEPAYALLHDPSSRSHNRYGTPIETVPEGHALRGLSLNINGDAA